MNVITRGIRNTFRNNIRTLSIVIILGLSIGLALSMGIARGAVQQKIASVKSSIGNTISISPAGARGFAGGGNALTDSQMNKIKNLTHVSGITETLSDRLTTSNTNLKSAISAGTLGARFATNSGVSFTPSNNASFGGTANSGGSSSGTFSFTPPVEVTGTNNVTDPSVYSATSVKITSGQAFNPSLDSDVAIVGASLASKNNLKVGSTFTAYNTTIKVVAIYNAGNTFANAGLIMPLPTVQRLSSQTGDITSATVTVDSIDNLGSVTSAITSQLGSAADVVSSQQASDQAIAPLQNIKTISLYSLIGAVVASAVIILLTMVMIVRERRREIGVLKAIGASNIKVISQFMSEAITFTILGAIIGLIIGVIGGNPITKVLVNNSSNSTTNSAQISSGEPSSSAATVSANSNGGGPTTTFTRSAGAAVRRLGINGTNIRDIHTAVGWSILLYGFGAALLIAIVGSAIPAFLISKIRPAEVMRSE